MQPSRFLRTLADRFDEFNAKLPARPTRSSAGAGELSSLRSEASGGGIQRANAVGYGIERLRLSVVHSTTQLRGVVELFRAMERTTEYNQAAVTALLRSQAEVAAEASWILVSGTSARERASRVLRWRFEDLRNLRRMLFALDTPTEVLAKTDPMEAGLVAEAKAFGWSVRASSGTTAAALTPVKDFRYPGYGEMVDEILGRGMYSVLCVAAHGFGWAARMGTKPIGDELPDGRRMARIVPFGVEPRLALRISSMCVMAPASRLAEWYGLKGAAERANNSLRELVSGLDGVLQSLPSDEAQPGDL